MIGFHDFEHFPISLSHLLRQFSLASNLRFDIIAELIYVPELEIDRVFSTRDPKYWVVVFITFSENVSKGLK